MQFPNNNQGANIPGLTTRPKPRVNWWIRMTSTGWDQPQDTIEQREKVRRSRLTSWIFLAVLLALVAFIPGAISDRASAIAVIVATIVMIGGIFLNRKGYVTIAGVLIVIMTCLAITGVIIGSPDGHIHLVYLPAFDLLVLAIILGASILPPMATFIIAIVNIILIYSDLLLQPWSPDLYQAINQYGMTVIAGRPVAVQIVTAIISFLWVRGMQDAIKRADRAEELRNLQEYIQKSEADRAALIEEFVRTILTAVEALANGQEGVVILPLQHPLQPQATFINNQLKQFYKLKRGNSVNNEHIVYATNTLLKTLQHINIDHSMVRSLDPQRFSTQVPVVDEIARYLFFFLQGKSVPLTMPETQQRSDSRWL